MYINILVKQVYWYISQVSGERLQDHWSSGSVIHPNILILSTPIFFVFQSSHFCFKSIQPLTSFFFILSINAPSILHSLIHSFLKCKNIFYFFQPTTIFVCVSCHFFYLYPNLYLLLSKTVSLEMLLNLNFC